MKLLLQWGDPKALKPEHTEEFDNVSVLIGKVSELLNSPEPPKGIAIRTDLDE